MRLIDADYLKLCIDEYFVINDFKEIVDNQPTEAAVPRETISKMGEDLRIAREMIKDEKALIGFNMAIAITNKYLEGV